MTDENSQVTDNLEAVEAATESAANVEVLGSDATESHGNDQPVKTSIDATSEPVVAEPGDSENAENAEPEKKVRPPRDNSGKDTSRMNWYVVHVYSGFELKAKQALDERIRTFNMEPVFGEVRVPQETVVELIRGQKKTSSRKFFPGYILVQMEVNQDSWHLVKETPKITGFVGDATDPSPLSEEEVSRILAQVEEGATSPRSRMTFEQGEAVKVIDGPFTDFNGTVDAVNPEKGKVRVLISIFGRATPVELDFFQVEKS